MVIGPGLFEAMREKFDRLSAFRSPDEKADCRCAKTADQPKNIFHALFPLRCCSRVGCGWANFVCMGSYPGLPGRRFRRDEWKRLHFEYGFGSLRSSAWYRGPCGSQNGGDCGGCGDGAESGCLRRRKGDWRGTC